MPVGIWCLKITLTEETLRTSGTLKSTVMVSLKVDANELGSQHEKNMSKSSQAVATMSSSATRTTDTRTPDRRMEI